MQIKRVNDKLQINIYRKKTYTDIYINWYSNTLEVYEKSYNNLSAHDAKAVDNIIENEIKKQSETSEDVKQVERERTTRIGDKTVLTLDLPYYGQKGHGYKRV